MTKRSLYGNTTSVQASQLTTDSFTAPKDADALGIMLNCDFISNINTSTKVTVLINGVVVVSDVYIYEFTNQNNSNKILRGHIPANAKIDVQIDNTSLASSFNFYTTLVYKLDFVGLRDNFNQTVMYEDLVNNAQLVAPGASATTTVKSTLPLRRGNFGGVALIPNLNFAVTTYRDAEITLLANGVAVFENVNFMIFDVANENFNRKFIPCDIAEGANINYTVSNGATGATFNYSAIYLLKK